MTFREESRVCKICGKEFKPNQHNQIYCSNSCGKIKINALLIKCKICGEEFNPKSVNQKCCSGKCKKINKDKNWREWYRKKVGHKSADNKKECKICNKEFETNNYGTLFCSRECKLKSQREKALERYYKNKDKILERRRNNLEWCILNKLRMRISCAVKSQGTYKGTKTIKLVGCSVEKLKQYLEKQFKEGMDWKNYGKDGWHIDHIIPCASFDLTIIENQLKCFHYSNLQPLWAKENLMKNCKVLANED